MTKQKNKVRRLNVAQAKELFMILRIHTDMDIEDIREIMKALIERKFIKKENYF